MGLDALRKIRERKSSGGARFLNIKDGKTFRIRLLQELDEGSINYNAEDGVGLPVVQHTPKVFEGYKKVFRCTAEDGACYGCEKYSETRDKDWRPQGKLYVNVWVKENADAEGYVAILSHGINAKNVVTNTLLELADEYNTVTNRWYKLSREGAGMTDTKYTFTGLDPSEFDRSELEIELFPLLGNVVRDLSYDEQEELSSSNSSNSEESEQEVSSGAKQEEW